MKIRNWQKFQHYRDRCPPWIKLHYELLSSADWVMLDDASRVLAIACMLIASRNNGDVPDDPEYIKRVAYLHRVPNFKPLISCGFLVNDSGCKQLLADDTQETEAEEETDQRQIPRMRADEFDLFWKAYPKKIGKKAALRAWDKAKDRPNISTILAAVAAAKRSEQWRRDGGQYIPNPATWINQGRWDDEVKAPPGERKPAPPKTREQMLAEMTDDDREKFRQFEADARENYSGLTADEALARFCKTIDEVERDEEI